MPAALLVLCALLAQAAPPTATPEAKAKAQQLLKEGAKLYGNGVLAEALEKFTQAYKEYASPKLLFNIGQASRDLGRLAEAMDAFEQFLEEATDAPEDMTSEARTSIDELVPKLGRLRVVSPTSGAEVSVDGKQVGATPLPKLVWVLPGSHQVTGKHPNTTPAVENVDVAAGNVLSVNLLLEPIAKPVGAARAVASPLARENKPADIAASPALSASDNGWLLGRKWTWVAVGGAFAFGATASVFGLSMQSKVDSLTNQCGAASGNGPCPESEISKATFRMNMANAFWGLTAAAAATSAVLFFVEGSPVAVAPIAGEQTGMAARMVF